MDGDTEVEMDRDDDETLLEQALALQEKLQQREKVLDAECSWFEGENTKLQNNITKLYKTAKEELDKKDKMIGTLRSSQIISELKEEKDAMLSQTVGKPEMPWER
jgi:hypothetical protein